MITNVGLMYIIKYAKDQTLKPGIQTYSKDVCVFLILGSESGAIIMHGGHMST